MHVIANQLSQFEKNLENKIFEVILISKNHKSSKIGALGYIVAIVTFSKLFSLIDCLGQ